MTKAETIREALLGASMLALFVVVMGAVAWLQTTKVQTQLEAEVAAYQR